MITFVVALLVSLAVTPCVVWLARRWSLIDVPNHRSLHGAPVPRGAGIAVVTATLAGLVAGDRWTDELVTLMVGSVVLAVVGLVDDRWGLPPLPRLAAQIVIPVGAVLVLATDSGNAIVLWLLAAPIVVAAFVNAFNFMDGINGISGLQAVVVGLFLAVVADAQGEMPLTIAGLAVAGGALGFLPFNLPGAVIFLGDVGSYFLGAWLVGLAMLVVQSGAAPLVVVTPFLLYLLDTGWVLVRRARRGAPLTEAHREHVYQRLVGLGGSHAAVAGLCAAVTAACAAVGWATRGSGITVQSVALLLCVGIVGAYLKLPTILESRQGVGAP